ncbi:MAG: YcgL domain-containing protein [Succinivibrio sp.]|nr:YcgL domain-containing protein [Succinivibrio sp.]
MRDTIVYVYKSSKRLRGYLYLREKDDFSVLPEALFTAFGMPQFLMMFALKKHPVLPKITPEQLQAALDEKGFLLRIDTEEDEESLINEERRYRGLPPLTREQLNDFFH